MRDALLLDLKDAVRRLARAPLSSVCAVATLALALGAMITAFSLLAATSLRKIDAPDPDALVAISASSTPTNRRGYIYADAFEAFRHQQQSFTALAMYSGGLFRLAVQRGDTIDVSGEAVTPELFDILQARLVAGRWFATGVPRELQGIEVVVSEALWHRLFGADDAALGQTISVDGRGATIVGVLATGFSGLSVDTGTDVWLPLSFVGRVGDNAAVVRAQYMIGRLAPGATLEQARAELNSRWPAIQTATANALPPALRTAAESQIVVAESVARGFSIMRTQYGRSFELLVGLTVVLLAVAAVNVTGLMTARAIASGHVVAVKQALGATRWRILRQFTLDGLLLALAGLVLAILLGWLATRILATAFSFARTLPLQQPLTPDLDVLFAVGGIAVVLGIVISVFPAWRGLAAGDGAIRGGRAVTRGLSRAGRAVLIVQVALSMVLLVGAGLFASMLWRLDANQAGFRGRNVAFAGLARIPGDVGALDVSYFRALHEQVAALAGVQSVVYSTPFPAALGFRGALPLDEFSAVDGAGVAVRGMTQLVSPGFFEMFGINQMRGRDFTWSDDERAPDVAIINVSLAASLFPQGNAVGERIRQHVGDSSLDLEIVGTVADAPMGSIREPHIAVVFRPFMQQIARAQTPMMHLRARADGETIHEAYPKVVASHGRHFVRGVLTLDGWMDNALLQERLLMAVALYAAVLAALLACLGIYAALAFAVAIRRREFGMRIALGASPMSVVRLVVFDGLSVVGVGVVVGVPLAIVVATTIRSQLYGVAPTEPGVVAACATIVLLTGAVASAIPALGVLRIHPTQALRED